MQIRQKSVMRNGTVTTFILLGLTDDPQLQVLIFIFLFLTYMLSVTGNLTIITLTFLDSHLKTPMYFFLKNFSFLEISFTSACIPRYLYNIVTGNKVITNNACMTQVFFTDLCGTTEFFLLAAMSYDRYVAICKPLHYMTIVNSRVCRILIICCWMAGLCVIIPLLSLCLNLEFCDSNVLDHFACDAFPLVKISCSDTWIVEQTVIICAVLTLNMTLTCVVLSYSSIIRTIFRFPSVQQRKKAFSTCSSHMIVVSITYGTCFFIYMNPTAKEEVTINKAVSLLFSSVSPTLNPFIYTLRNNQVKKAFKGSFERLALLSTK
ncbi:olfactory receptor 6C2-like [Trichechus manatus latirostris]|uniref:Olfactory receptor n=1 Tax=Trichechus manatus latirostris TaxID=127582 RepID=A0A2Y9DG78_TRIMA|nr:olfactory receptor 6C2-like [Trichechus manatus latirostris]